MGRKVARRRRKAYIESLIYNEKQHIEKQKEKKQNKKDRELIMDKLYTLQLDPQTPDEKVQLQSDEEVENKIGNKINKLSKPIVKKQRAKDRRRLQKIRNRMQQAAAMFSS